MRTPGPLPLPKSLQYSRFYAGELLRALISVARGHGKVVSPKLIPEARETRRIDARFIVLIYT